MGLLFNNTAYLLELMLIKKNAENYRNQRY